MQIVEIVIASVDGVCMQDIPLPIGFGQTISAPHMHATCLELLESRLKPGAALDP